MRRARYNIKESVKVAVVVMVMGWVAVTMVLIFWMDGCDSGMI